ncbi:MAG: 30S ribosomal protein S7 [Candidatus Komeilibacteria bacterium]|nr:30S ribosomal protein S7 [Candidatus Komeilibacteria bacterium]
MRGKQSPKRKIAADPKFFSLKIGKFINYIMRDGKKTTAQAIVYSAFEIIAERSKGDALAVFEEALKNISPSLEVKSKRIGGANYQIPIVVSPDRRLILAFRWLITATKHRKGKPMAIKLADELMSAAKGEGEAVKKREDTHKMAEANRAFAHFA